MPSDLLPLDDLVPELGHGLARAEAAPPSRRPHLWMARYQHVVEKTGRKGWTNSQATLVRLLPVGDPLRQKLLALRNDKVAQTLRVFDALRGKVRVGLVRVLKERCARLWSESVSEPNRGEERDRRTRANQIVRFLWCTFMRKNTIRDWR